LAAGAREAAQASAAPLEPLAPAGPSMGRVSRAEGSLPALRAELGDQWEGRQARRRRSPMRLLGRAIAAAPVSSAMLAVSALLFAYAVGLEMNWLPESEYRLPAPIALRDGALVATEDWTSVYDERYAVSNDDQAAAEG